MRTASVLLLVLLAACGSEEKSPMNISDPVSVRGWITDVKDAKRAETMEMEIARRTELFTSSSVWIEEFQYASGGIAENGSFIILDVPADKATLGFNAPGAENAKLALSGIPGNADVFIPNIVLEPGGAKVLDPKAIVVRVPASIDKPRPTGQMATVAGIQVPVMEMPISAFVDRRDYPQPSGFRPVATVK